jgi:hypothetical protein
MPNEKPEPQGQSQSQSQSSQQQGAAANDGQAQSGSKVEGEGSYSATRDYQKNIQQYLDKADVQADGEAAKPRSEAEARELDEAEREARSHSKGER